MTEPFDFEAFFQDQLHVPIIENIKEPIPVSSITKEKESEMMRQYLNYNKLTQQHLDVYNQFTKNIANIIMSKTITLKDGRVITFDQVEIKKPTYKEKNTEYVLTPSYSRSHFLTYDAEVSANLIIKRNNSIIYTNKNRILIYRLPVMLFSNLCHLENKTNQELVELGEDPIEQGGYFIVEGREFILMLEEKLSTNRIFIMNSSPKIREYSTALKLTTNTSKGTALNELIYKTQDLKNILKYSFQSLRKKSDKTKPDKFGETKKMNVIYVFQLFSIVHLNSTYCYEVNDIIDLIKPYLINVKSLHYLYPSLSALSQMKPITAAEVLMKKIGKGNLSENEKREAMVNELKTVLEHMDDIEAEQGESKEEYEYRIIKLKVNLLAIMVAKYLDYLGGFTPLDDRDDWGNKRVEGPGRKMEHLTKQAWNKAIKDINDKSLRDDIKNEQIEQIFHGINGQGVSVIITKNFRDAFTSTKWGIKGQNQKNNATQSLVRDNLLATLSHINTINVNIQRTDKNSTIRLAQSNQYRYVCYVKTPEGSSCGLVKNLTITSKLSLNRGIQGDHIIGTYLSTTVDKTVTNQHIVLLNGKFMGWCQGEETRQILLDARRKGEIYYDTSLYIDDRYLIIDVSPSRLLSPVLIVDPESQQLVIDVKNITDLTPENLIEQGAMEYISALEERNLKIAMDVNHLKKSTKPFTHCEMSGRAALGVAADMIPFMQHNQAPRNTYQSSMGTQALSIPHLNHKGRFDGTIKILESPTPPIVKTSMYDQLGLTERGMGQNVIVAFMAYPGTEEDAFIFNKASIDRGLFRMVKYFTIRGAVKISDRNVKAYFAKPMTKTPEEAKRYQNINENGLPIIGSFIDEHQCVIGIIKEKNGIKQNASIYTNQGEQGVVEDVSIHSTLTDHVVTVKLSTTRTPKKGWKFAARSAQKGTIGLILESHQLPFEESTGIVPDIIVNTSVIPSRMTVSYLLELIAGKAAAMYGETVDASAFQPVDLDKYKQMLRDVGLNSNGYSRLRSGETGEKIDADIYMGVIYFQALKHQPEDKATVRNKGSYSSTTHQPVKGRQNGGGLRIGGMEVDTFLAHGASSIVKERLCNVSDVYKMAECKGCGTPATFNSITKEFECSQCELSNAVKVTIPYVYKYLRQLLGVMSVKVSHKFDTTLDVDEEIKEEEEEEEDVESDEFSVSSSESEKEYSEEEEDQNDEFDDEF